MTPRAVVSSVDEPPGRSDLGGRRTPQLQVRTTAVPAEAGRGRRSESPQLKPTILTLPRPWVQRRAGRVAERVPGRPADRPEAEGELVLAGGLHAHGDSSGG